MPIEGKRPGSDNTRDCKLSGERRAAGKLGFARRSPRVRPLAQASSRIPATWPASLHQILTTVQQFPSDFQEAPLRAILRCKAKKETLVSSRRRSYVDYTILLARRFDIYTRSFIVENLLYQSCECSLRGNFSSFSAPIASSCLNCSDLEEFVLVAEVNDF